MSCIPATGLHRKKSDGDLSPAFDEVKSADLHRKKSDTHVAIVSLKQSQSRRDFDFFKNQNKEWLSAKLKVLRRLGVRVSL